MKEIYTYTFRDFVRNVCRKRDISISHAWTDARYKQVSPGYWEAEDTDNRVVTFDFKYAEDATDVLKEVGKLMELAGIDAQSQGLRITDSGYLKCNCVKPTLVKFN